MSTAETSHVQIITRIKVIFTRRSHDDFEGIEGTVAPVAVSYRPTGMPRKKVFSFRVAFLPRAFRPESALSRGFVFEVIHDCRDDAIGGSILAKIVNFHVGILMMNDWYGGGVLHPCTLAPLHGCGFVLAFFGWLLFRLGFFVNLLEVCQH